MRKKWPLGARILVFLIGIAIVCLAFKMFAPALSGHGYMKCLYVFICMALIYLMIFIPLLFMKIRIKNDTVPLFCFAWNVIFCFAVLCGLSAYFLISDMYSVNAAFIVLVILLALGISGVIVKVSIFHRDEYENNRQGLGLISQIQASMGVLVLKTAALPEKNFNEKRKIEALGESINQMMPVSTIDAAKLEQEILMNVTQISSLCDSVIAGSDDENLKKLLTVIENQIRERKLKDC